MEDEEKLRWKDRRTERGRETRARGRQRDSQGQSGVRGEIWR